MYLVSSSCIFVFLLSIHELIDFLSSRDRRPLHNLQSTKRSINHTLPARTKWTLYKRQARKTEGAPSNYANTNSPSTIRQLIHCDTIFQSVCATQLRRHHDNMCHTQACCKPDHEYFAKRKSYYYPWSEENKSDCHCRGQVVPRVHKPLFQGHAHQVPQLHRQAFSRSRDTLLPTVACRVNCPILERLQGARRVRSVCEG